MPNLDYKVATGDSLTGPAPEQISLASHLIDQIQEHQAEFLVTHTDPEKQRLREEIAELKGHLQEWQASDDEFVWQVEFPEVFQEGGFDIVIGNPPYLHQKHERVRALKPTLKHLYPEVYTGTADLYVYFYKRGTELLRKRGILTYISSNTFLRVEFGKKLRVFLTDKVCLHRLLDFGSVPVFKATVDTCILLVEKVVPSGEAFFAVTFCDKADVLDLSNVFQKRAFSMHACDLSLDGWTLTSPDVLGLLEKLQQIGTPLGKYVDDTFYRGMTTGCNDAFIISESVRQQLIAEDPRSVELIKPVLRGRDLKKWKTESTSDYLIFTYHGIDIEQYPAIKRYLNQYRLDLEPKKSRGQKRGRKMGDYKWYEVQDVTAYSAEFEKPKIIYPYIAKSLYVCYDIEEAFGVNTIYFIPSSDFSLFAILGSQLFDWYARHKFQTLQDPWTGGSLVFQESKHEGCPNSGSDRSTESGVVVPR